MCGREAIDCTHSGGLELKISANLFSSRLPVRVRTVLAVDPNIRDG